MDATPMTQKHEPLSPDFTPQRRHARVPFEVEVNVESDHNFYTGFTQNISEGGLFISTNKLLPMGAKIAFSFRFDPKVEPLSVYGVVRWLRESSPLTDDAPPGMGCAVRRPARWDGREDQPVHPAPPRHDLLRRLSRPGRGREVPVQETLDAQVDLGGLLHR